MTSTFKRLGQSELLPRYIFAESLVARRRVLEIGAVASTLGQSARFLSTRGARIVVAADNDLAAVQEAQARLASPTLRFRAAVFDDFESGSFDLVIVSDLAPYVRAPELMKDVARLVAKSGYLMGGLRNPAGLALSNVLEADETDVPPTYGQLLDLLSGFFKSVDVATQSPVLGYQLAFERGEGLQVDGSLAGMSEAAYYVVLAGHEEVRNFDPTWVQLPPEPLAFTGGRLEDASNRARDWRERTEKLKEILERKTAELKVREGDLHENQQQLEAAKDAVSRLTAQLESVRERPEVARDREDLATRIRQQEAELQVARERAIDAEGRVAASRHELEAISRQQKDSAITSLAAQEGLRLERARREELATQLEDSRLRLAKSYEELRRVQDEATSERVEHERTKISIGRLKESVEGREKELKDARDRELRLAEARTDALKAIENLEAGFADVRNQLAEAREAVDRKEAERSSSLRSFDVERQTRHGLEAELERERAQVERLSTDLEQRTTERTGAETEAAALKATLERLEGALTLSRSSEERWRQATREQELRLGDTSTELQVVTHRLGELERQLGTSDRSAQELREELAVARARVSELEELLRVSRQNADRLSAVVEEDRARLTELEVQVTSSAFDRKQLTESLAQAETQLLTARKQAEERGEALSSAARRERELEQALRLAESRVKELTDDRDALLTDRDDLRGSLADVEKVRVEQVGRLGEVSERADSLATRLSELEGGLARARSELERTAQDASAQERALKNVLAERELSLTDALRTGDEARAELAHERTAVASLEAARDAALRTLDETGRAFEDAKAELALLREDRERTHALLETAQRSLAQTVESRELLDLERVDLEQRYRTLEADARLVGDRTASLEVQVQELRGELREAEEQAVLDREALEVQLELKDTQLQRAAEARSAVDEELKRARLQAVDEAAAAQTELGRARAQAADDLAAAQAQLVRSQAQAAGELTAAQTELERARAQNAAERAAAVSELEGERAQAEAERVAAQTELQEERAKASGDLAAALTELERARAQAAAERAVAHSELQAVRAQSSGELAAAQAELERARAQAAAERAAAVSELQGVLAQSSGELAAAQDELGRARALAAAERAAAASELQQARAKADEERAQSSGELAAAQDELGRARAQAAAERAAAASEVQEARAKADEERAVAAAELQRARAQAGSTGQELNEAQARFDALTGRYAELRTRFDEASGRTARLEVAASELTTQLAAAQTATADRDARLEKLSSELIVSSQTVQRFEFALGELQAAQAATRDELGITRAQLETATIELAEKREAVTSLELSLDELRARAAAAESARDERKAQVVRLEGMLREREEGLGTTSANLLKLEEEKTLLSQSLATAMSEAEHVRLELEEALSSRVIERELREKGELDFATLTTTSTAARADLEGRLETFEKELQALRAERATLTESLTAARAELERSARAHADLQVEVEATKQASRRALDEKHAEDEGKLQAQRDEHQRSLEQHQRALQTREAALSTELAAAETKAAEFEAQRAQLKLALELAQAEGETAATTAAMQLDAVNQLYVEASGAIERAQSEARGHQSGKLALQQELDQLRGELTTLRVSLTQVGGESRAATDARAQLEAEVERLRQRLPPLETELASLKGQQPELEQLRARVPQLEGTLAATQQHLATLTASDRELKRQVLEFDVALAQARAVAAELEGARVDTSAARIEQELELKSLRDRFSAAETEAARLREARLTDEETSLELRSRNTLLEAQLADASRVAAPSDEEIAQVRRRLTELEAELEIARVNARHDVETAQAARQQAEELLLALRVKYGDLQHNLTTTAEDLTEARAEYELLDGERERLAQQVEELETRLRAAQEPKPSSPLVPPLVESPVEVFEIDVEGDEDLEEIVLIDDEAPAPAKKDP